MTVEELIKELQKQDPKMEVAFTIATSKTEQTININKFDVGLKGGNEVFCSDWTPKMIKEEYGFDKLNKVFIIDFGTI